VEKSTGSGSYNLDYLYDLDGNVTGEWLVTPSWQGQAAHYIYFGGRLLAEYAASTTYFVHPDHLGSARLLTAPGGATRIQSSGGT